MSSSLDLTDSVRSKRLVLKKSVKGLSSLAGGFIIELVLGSFYLWGTLNIYVNSYYYNLDPSTKLSTSMTLVVFPLMSLFTHTSTAFGMRVREYVGLRKLLILSSIMMAGAVFASSYMPNFWLFMLFYAILFGIPGGLLYLPPLYNTYQYFPNKQGTISGIIFGGFGLGSTFATLLIMHIINPENKKTNEQTKYFDKEISDNVPAALRWLAFYFLALCIIGTMLIFPYDTQNIEKNSMNDSEIKSIVESKTTLMVQNVENVENEEPLLHEEQKAEVDSINNGEKKASNLSNNEKVDPLLLKQMVLTWRFAMMFIMMLCSSSYGYLITANYKNYGETKPGNDDYLLNYIGSTGAICNGGSRICWGLINQKVRFKILYFIILVMQIALCSTLSWASDQYQLYFLWVCLSLTLEGGHFVIFPAVCSKIYGNKLGTKVYGVLFFSCFLANLSQFFLVNFLQDVIGYNNIFWIFVAGSGVSFILMLFFKEDPVKNKSFLED